MQISQTQENGQTIYKFTARGVKYDVITRNGTEFNVFSNRTSHAGGPVLTCYDSLGHLATRSKTFSNFAALIAA